MKHSHLLNHYLCFLSRDWTQDEFVRFNKISSHYEHALRCLPDEFEKSVVLSLWAQSLMMTSHTWRDQKKSLEKKQSQMTNAIEWVLAKSDRSLSWSRDDLAALHAILSSSAACRSEFRKRAVYCWSREFLPAHLIPEMVAELESKVLNCPNLNPIVRAGRAYQWIKCIHPFLDGNARLASLVRDGILLQSGYLPVTLIDPSEGIVGIFLDDSPTLTPADSIFKTLLGSIQTLEKLVSSSDKLHFARAL